ncbi:hypothetical protein NQ317_007262 [Molorchus minor]|uniref:Schwannomin interacting protein 1 C-terminal domain-containing protein n=1 Tax=Molorchus minor TaxID=1323400 RepID=A0ABQ9JIH2_9CUCU|nr:hypothetical protein NQ317_007262 [Molorchus minor]
MGRMLEEDPQGCFNKCQVSGEEENMRLKTMDGPLSYHNGNNDILNSPKRINTIQNSNVTYSNYTSTTSDYSTSDISNNVTQNVTSDLTDGHTGDLNTSNNATLEKVQWCNPSHEAKKRELTNNANNRNNQLLNINNTLAASLRNQVRIGTASSICSESSPDDSLLDYEEAHQSCSSVDTSPQDEDRGFDVSDSESSDEGNLSNGATLQRRGIVNPNYPGFQHLAHTLDYSIKASSDTDFTDDDLECESLAAKLQSEANVTNNNNNNAEDTDYQIDSKKAIPRLDTHENIVGDLSKEIEVELGRVTLDAQDIFEDPYKLPNVEKAVVQELEEAAEKLQVIKDLQPSAIKYNIEPNIEQPFNKLSPTTPKSEHVVLEDSKVIKNSDTMILLHQNSPLYLKEVPSKITLDLADTNDKMKSKVTDAFLSSAHEDIALSPLKEEKHFDESLKVDKNQIKIDDSDLSRRDTNRELQEIEDQLNKIKAQTKLTEDLEIYCKEDITKAYREKDEDSAVLRKKERVEYEMGARSRDPLNRRSVPMTRDRKKMSSEALGFDVYNIETAMPKIDMEAIEYHLRAAREEERRVVCEVVVPNFLVIVSKFISGKMMKECSLDEDDPLFKHIKRRLSFQEVIKEMTSLKRKRHYKKDTAYLYDLYTLTFDENETLESLDETDSDYYDNDFLSPRAYSMTTFSMDYNAVNENMEWFPYVPPSYDEQNVVDRFIRVITIDDDNPMDRRTDREEIRRRLAMGSEDEYYMDRPGRKPSLHSDCKVIYNDIIIIGMNLQICFMNETVSDNESPSSDSECPMTNPKQPKTPIPKTSNYYVPYQNNPPAARPATLSIGQPLLQPIKEPMTETDFFTRQARLQTEARMALAQAKEMARMQMQIERQKQKKSPITEMVRHSLEKVGIPFPEEKRRLSRQILTEMNVAQLQVIVNDLHTQIETLNENLVKFLMNRDDLHMEQDSMLVDIEDLTRYLGAKEQNLREQNLTTTKHNNNLTPPSPAPASPLSALNSSVKPHLHRIASLVKK